MMIRSILSYSKNTTSTISISHKYLVPCLRELSYRSGLLDRPGSFYDMQNDIEDELETSSDDAQAIESKEKFVLDIYVL